MSSGLLLGPVLNTDLHLPVVLVLLYQAKASWWVIPQYSGLFAKSGESATCRAFSWLVQRPNHTTVTLLAMNMDNFITCFPLAAFPDIILTSSKQCTLRQLGTQRSNSFRSTRRLENLSLIPALSTTWENTANLWQFQWRVALAMLTAVDMFEKIREEWKNWRKKVLKKEGKWYKVIWMTGEPLMWGKRERLCRHKFDTKNTDRSNESTYMYYDDSLSGLICLMCQFIWHVIIPN